MTTTNTTHDKFAIIYVDDEEQALKYFRKEFKHEYPILTAPGAMQALEVLEKEHAGVGVLLTDYRMSGRTGVELLSQVRQRWPNIVRILVTAYSDMASAVDAVNSGAVYKYLTKPVDPVHLGQVLREAMDGFLERHRKDMLLERKMSQIQHAIVTDRVNSMAALASGISHHVRNSMTAMTCYFEELDSAGQAAPQDSYLAELRELAKKEREQLAQIIQSVSAHAVRPQLRIEDQAELFDLLQRAADEAGPGPSGKGVSIDVPPGLATLKADSGALVRMLRSLIEHVARHGAGDAPVKISADAPVPHWNTTGARLIIRGSGPAWSDQDVAAIFTPFAVSHSAPRDLGLDLLDTFQIAMAHGGDLITHRSAPLGPGFELRLPLDPGAVCRPPADESCLLTASL